MANSLPPLWNHQHYGIDEVLLSYKSGERRVLLTSPTGMGKSRSVAEIIRDFLERDLPVCLYTNRRLLLDQLNEAMTGFGFDAGLRMAGRGANADRLLQISSIQTESARTIRKQLWEMHPASLVVVDECFAEGTMILTTEGEKPIESISPGDKVINACGIGKVKVVSKKPSYDLYLVELSNGNKITCTGSHPFFTEQGWRTARTMANGSILFCPEDVSYLWQDMGAEEDWPLWKTIHHGRTGFCSPGLLLSILLQEDEEPHALARVVTQDAGVSSKNQASPFTKRRKRAIAAFASIGPSSRSGGGVGIGTASANQEGQGERLSNMLQDRHRQSGFENWVRSGWWFPLRESDSTGYEENRTAEVVRVVNVSRIERESPTPVWNLRVSGHPSYFANGVLVHNCHLMKSRQAVQIMNAHYADGAFILGVTATPLELEGLYDTIIQAGSNSEGRACGALLPVHHFGPNEPDMRILKAKPALGQDFSERQARELMMTTGIFGRVVKAFQEINPTHKPTILFAPGVEESLWFAEQFVANGITAAHIDGKQVWINGEFIKGKNARQQALDGSRDGTICVLSNRFVLREGIDCPWLAHGIFATVFGSIQSFLQSGGRLLRSYPGLDHVTLQDHGGNWWRHGSLNADRTWKLGDTPGLLAAMREDRLRAKKEPEPRRCPACSQITVGSRCPCGHVVVANQMKSRPVVQSDGTLKEMTGDIFRPRKISTLPDGAVRWESMYFRSLTGRGSKTFRAAMALFYQENGGWPDPDWKWMPIHPDDFTRYVTDVPRERLR